VTTSPRNREYLRRKHGCPCSLSCADEAFPALPSPSAPAESRASTRRSRPRRSARALTSLPPAPRDRVPSGFPVAAVLHWISGSSAAAPPAVGTVLRGASSRDRPRTTLRLTLGCSRSSRHRRPLHPCSASLDPTPSGGRHAARYGQTARGTAYLRFAWPLPPGAVVAARRGQPMKIGSGSWVVGARGCLLHVLRPCPCRCDFQRRDHPKDPSLRRRYAAPPSSVLRSSRTSAAPLSLGLQPGRFACP
jgi:hypothetical protein